MIRGAAPFCDTHKQQMSFVKFEPLEQNYTCQTLCTIENHGLANKYCKQCKMALCANCAFDHATHGATSIEQSYEEYGALLSDILSELNIHYEKAESLIPKARLALKKMQQVCKSSSNHHTLGKPIIGATR